MLLRLTLSTFLLILSKVSGFLETLSDVSAYFTSFYKPVIVQGFPLNCFKKLSLYQNMAYKYYFFPFSSVLKTCKLIEKIKLNKYFYFTWSNMGSKTHNRKTNCVVLRQIQIGYQTMSSLIINYSQGPKVFPQN